MSQNGKTKCTNKYGNSFSSFESLVVFFLSSPTPMPIDNNQWLHNNNKQKKKSRPHWDRKWTCKNWKSLVPKIQSASGWRIPFSSPFSVHLKNYILHQRYFAKTTINRNVWNYASDGLVLSLCSVCFLLKPQNSAPHFFLFCFGSIIAININGFGFRWIDSAEIVPKKRLINENPKTLLFH